jgi:signal peptidase I
MQCVNCQFQNMPGSAVCGRCGTSLGLAATTSIDVHPPRAGRWRKRVRQALPVRRAYFGMRDAAERARSTRVATPGCESAFLLRLAVPAWPQFHAGQRLRGHLVLWSFLACVLSGLLLLGTTAGSVLLGLAFSVHTTGALDAVMLNFADCGTRDRWARAFLLSAAIGTAVYLPAGWLLTQIAEPHTMERPIGPLNAGDVILVNARARPLPGRIVLYEVPGFREEVARTGHGVYQYFGGPAIERVIAGPGDEVRIEHGALTVNGATSRFVPLGAALPASLNVRVPADHCLILPAAMSLTPLPDDVETWKRISVIPLTSVTGTVYARTHPLSDWAIIR